MSDSVGFKYFSANMIKIIKKKERLMFMKKWIVVLCSISILIFGSFSVMAENAEQPKALRTLYECHELLAEAETEAAIEETAISETEEAITPYAVAHCQSGSQVGRYSERLLSSEQIGYETRSCTHAVQGALDKRYQYLDRYQATCTLCDYKAYFSETRWGAWFCTK